MTFKVWIGVDNKGNALMGADAVKRARKARRLHSSVRVFGSQLSHRVRAWSPSRRKWTITTPTRAKSLGLKKVRGGWPRR